MSEFTKDGVTYKMIVGSKKAAVKIFNEGDRVSFRGMHGKMYRGKILEVKHGEAVIEHGKSVTYGVGFENIVAVEEKTP